ncbi:MAG: hypothetical protein AAFU73_05840 [Planctomycetota bacterium]
MTRVPSPTALLRPLRSALFALACAAPALAQGAMEEFDAVDPHTEGDAALLANLGYEAVGNFIWQGGEFTDYVKETMGGTDVLFVETKHFVIGSSLVTYRVPGDRQEKEKLEAEFEVFEERLGKKKWKAPKRDVDPWLRLHLYAQRSEALYTEFVEAFGLPDDGATENGPHLGHEQKFKLLVCERKSELGRYLRAYESGVNDFSFRSGSPKKGMFFGLNAEVLRQGFDDLASEPVDSMLHNLVADGIVRNFVDGYDQELYSSPEWFTNALGFAAARRVDPRWVQTGAPRNNDDYWKWDERVKQLVKNDFYAALGDMFQWRPRREWKEREYMVAWSKGVFLLEEHEFDRPAFLRSMVTPMPGKPENSAEELDERQRAVFAAHLDVLPEDFDEAWAKWVSKKKRGRKKKRRR